MSRLPRILLVAVLVVAAGLIYFSSYAQEKSAKADFEMTASYIEACSCDMFCPCYFNTHSTNHMGGEHHMDEHFCRANLVLKVDKGHYKETKLDERRCGWGAILAATGVQARTTGWWRISIRASARSKRRRCLTF